MKFLFPNPHDVYLHDTPADALFARQGRALSHGCVRLEKPEELARYMLRDSPEWDDATHREGDARGRGAARGAEGEAAGPHRVFHGLARRATAACRRIADVYGYDAKQAGVAPAGGAPRGQRRLTWLESSGHLLDWGCGSRRSSVTASLLVVCLVAQDSARERVGLDALGASRPLAAELRVRGR